MNESNEKKSVQKHKTKKELDKSQGYHTVAGEQVAVGRRWDSIRVNGIGWGAERKRCGRELRMEKEK